ncbi:carboxymuconolactone decarboxylase [Sphingobium baderi LL03]|nr:carboxymuconolactone decarboxylase [Sphingobium baderi LL03]
MTDEQREAALALLRSFDSQVMREAAEGGAKTGFAQEIGPIAFENVFARLWTRPGLDKRARSLLTLGILIGLRSEDELQIHMMIALANGLTMQELEEVIYHASGYAGFPAANSARRAAVTAFRKEGLID